MRRRFCFLFFMLFVLTSLNAEEKVRLSWSHEDDSVSFYRWRRGNEEWNITPELEAQSFYRYGDVEIYHIEASYDGENGCDDGEHHKYGECYAILIESEKQFHVL